MAEVITHENSRESQLARNKPFRHLDKFLSLEPMLSRPYDFDRNTTRLRLEFRNMICERYFLLHQHSIPSLISR